MDLQDYRKEIDRIDSQILKLFEERMNVAEGIAKYKLENSLPVLDPLREQQKLYAISEQVPPWLSEYSVLLYSTIFDLSRSHQNEILGTKSKLPDIINDAVKYSPKMFPKRAVVACQGVQGAYSQLACQRLFRYPYISFCRNFEDVFSAIENGDCEYGIIPLENSTAGSVNRVYDLMMKRHFSIVRSVRVKIDHNLLVKPGTKLEDIKEIYSHEQAIGQCASFLRSMPNVQVTACRNTAVAAKMVAESERTDVAALSSRSCIELYHLDCLKESVQDNGNNFTRFICISKNLQIFPGADRTSLMVVLPHKEGALYKVLSRFYALGINLNKLESRPMPERNFEFMFYFDIECPVYSPKFLQLIGELDEVCDEVSYLGSYNEVI